MQTNPHLASVSAVLLLFLVAPSVAQTLPAERPGDFEITEWVVFTCDPNSTKLNQQGTFASSLPEFVSSRRESTADAGTDPCPVGIIRVTGTVPAGLDDIDILLGIKEGQFLAYWPKAQLRTKGLLWKNLTLNNEGVGLQTVAGGHWFGTLRLGESAYLTNKGHGERFLLYDAEIPYKLPLRVQGDALAYRVSNTGSAPLHEVQFYKPTEDGLRVGSLDLLPAAKRSSATAPATRAATQPEVFPTIVWDAPVKDPKLALEHSKARWAAAGMPDTDSQLLLSILAKYALDARYLSVVYRLDPAQLDEWLPLDITPRPRKITRLGLVIVRNIDPAISVEVDQMIAQLGDARWKVREAASKRLGEIGPLAKTQLEAALKNTDLEVVSRVERLLQALTPATAELNK